jgi:hypothetical protein
VDYNTFSPRFDFFLKIIVTIFKDPGGPKPQKMMHQRSKVCLTRLTKVERNQLDILSINPFAGEAKQTD